MEVVHEGQGRGVCHLHLSYCPLSLVCIPLRKDYKAALEHLLSSILWRGSKHQVDREVCAQRPCHGGLGMPNLASHKLASRLAFLHWSLTGDLIMVGIVRGAFPFLTISPPISQVECHHKHQDQSDFLHECRNALTIIPRSSDLGRSSIMN